MKFRNDDYDYPGADCDNEKLYSQNEKYVVKEEKTGRGKLIKI